MSSGADDRDGGSEINRGAIDRAAIIAEIKAVCEPVEPPQADEVTAAIMAEMWDCPRSTAAARLDRAVQAGILARRWASHPVNGKRQYAYRVAPDHTPPDTTEESGG